MCSFRMEMIMVVILYLIRAVYNSSSNGVECDFVNFSSFTYIFIYFYIYLILINCMQLIIYSILCLKYVGHYLHTPYVPYTFRHLVRFTYHKNTYQY